MFSKITWCLTVASLLGASSAHAMWGRAKPKNESDACTAMLGTPLDGMHRFQLIDTKNPLVDGVYNAPIRFLREDRGTGTTVEQLDYNQKRAQDLGMRLADFLFEIERRGNVQSIFEASMTIDAFGHLPQGELEGMADLIGMQLANLSHPPGFPDDLIRALDALAEAKHVIARGSPERPGAALPIDLEMYREKRMQVGDHLLFVQQAIRHNLGTINEARTRLMAYANYEQICATAVRTLSDVIDRRMRHDGGTELERERLNNNYLSFLTTREKSILRMRKAIAKFEAKFVVLTDANVKVLSMVTSTHEALGFLMDRSTEGRMFDSSVFNYEWNTVINQAAQALAELD